MNSTPDRSASPKPVIMMQPGPLHLFWTTGVFYFWLLKERFDFVFIVAESYRDSRQFAKLASLEAIRHVEIMPTTQRFSRQFAYSKRFQKLLRQYRPAYLLQHNRSYVENQYLIFWGRKICPETTRFYYQNGRVSFFIENDFATQRAEQIEALRRRFPRLSRNSWLTGRVLDARLALSFVLNNKVFPWLAIRATFSPPVNVLTGAVDREATQRLSNSDKDFLLSYLDNEIEAYRVQGIDNIIQIRHPLADCGSQVFRFLYGESAESDIILILPSYGFSSRMIQAGWPESDLAQHIATKWCQAIAKLLERFPGFALRMKLHPASLTDPVWREVIRLIRIEFSALEVVNPQESAEWHVVQSKVVVGDVTTVLWWAGMYGGKFVISLDIFGYPGGDELNRYASLIMYVNDLDCLTGVKVKKFESESLLSCSNIFV